MALEDILPVKIQTTGPCKGCLHGFDREEEGGKWWHVWDGRAYPCTQPPALDEAMTQYVERRIP